MKKTPMHFLIDKLREKRDLSIIYNSGGMPKQITIDRFNEKMDLVLNNLKSL